MTAVYSISGGFYKVKIIKKIFTFTMICAAALVFSACGSSSETEAASDMTEPSAAVVGDILSQTTEAEGIISSTDSTYSIPADAPTGVNGGPGMMETQAATINPNYPEDKQVVGAPSEGTMVCLYAAANYGIYQLFEYVDEANADSLVSVMTQDDILEAGTEVISFSNEGGEAELELNQLIAGYDSASEDQILACVANTFIENLGLDKLTITVDGETYGPLTFNDDYATVK